MLKDYGLYNPVQVERMMTADEFTKYVDITAEQKATGRPTNPELMDKIRKNFYETHPDVAKERLDELWATVEPWLLESEGLAQSMYDYSGEKSYYFFPWIISMHTSMSAALEASYNAGYHLNGNWVTDIPHEDTMGFYVRNDPTYIYTRECQLAIAKKVAELMSRVPDGEKAKVVDLGAGRLAWARHHGLKLDPSKIEVIASDTDETIVPEELFPDGLEKSGITYKRADLRMQLAAPECQGADFVILRGVASYYPREMLVNTIKAVYGMLNHGGVFFFDLQVDCPYLQRSVAAFGWPPLKLEDSAEKTISVAEAMRKELRQADMPFQARYTVDTYNEYPSAVMIELTKL